MLKPLIDLFWDRGPHKDFGCAVDFGDTAPKGETQVFVLSPELALAAEQLVRSPRFTFPTLDEMRMPYEHMAVEYALTPEIRSLRGELVSGTHQVTRVGAHTRTVGVEHRVFVCTPYWELENGVLQHSMMSFMFKEGMPGELTISLNTKNTPDGAIEMAVIPCTGVIKGMESAGVPPEALAQGMHTPEVQQHVREAGVEVPLLLFASSMLLSCKTGMSKARVDARTPTASGLGARKRKQLSASAFTMLYLSALEQVDGSGSVTPKSTASAHYVRGHFKQRKSGVYWWSPFVRGVGTPLKREAYIVKE